MSRKELLISKESYIVAFYEKNDNGGRGKAQECEDKIRLKSTRSKGVSSNKNAVDFQSKGIKYQSKTGCGEICHGSELSFKEWKKSNVMVYTPLHNGYNDSYHIEMDDFINLIIELGLTKYNESRNKWNIQTWYNSKKKCNAFISGLESLAFRIDRPIGQTTDKNGLTVTVYDTEWK